MSYELKIDPKSRAAGRFIGAVRKALVEAAIDEKRRSGISQQKVADCLGVNRSVINRMLNGSANLTLRSVAEVAWALGLEPTFSLRRRVAQKGDNGIPTVSPAAAGAHAIGTVSKLTSHQPVTTSGVSTPVVVSSRAHPTVAADHA